MYTLAYLNGEEIDPIKSTTFSTEAPKSPHTGDFYYHIDKVKKKLFSRNIMDPHGLMLQKVIYQLEFISITDGKMESSLTQTKNGKQEKLFLSIENL